MSHRTESLAYLVGKVSSIIGAISVANWNWFCVWEKKDANANALGSKRFRLVAVAVAVADIIRYSMRYLVIRQLHVNPREPNQDIVISVQVFTS